MKRKSPPDRDVKGSVVVITGGTGSFGKTVLKHLLQQGCKEIRIFSRDEKKQHDMRLEFANQPVQFYIGDVRDRQSLKVAMKGAQFVFHAAALKQVPTAEFFPIQAVMTNILGSANVLEVGIDEGVKSIVCLSTDKAVMPINAMGMTKGLMEKTLHSLVRVGGSPDTSLSLVRYGNVMCSRGSVIPLFMDQIQRGQPITVTDPNMTRFMLPLSQATDLVLLALREGRSGDTFIRKSPACTVEQLAQSLMRLFGRQVPVKTIGVRVGEKIDETLATAAECARAEDLGEYLRIPIETETLAYNKYFEEGGSLLTEYTSRSTHQLTERELDDLLRKLPEVQAALRNEAFEAA